MKVTALTAQSFRSIWNNKVRSILTVLGIVIGIASVMLLVGLGNGLKQKVLNQIGDLDVKQIIVSSKSPDQETAERKGGRFTFSNDSGLENLTEADYQKVKNTSNVQAASPQASAKIDATATAGAATATAYQLYGVSAAYATLNHYKLGTGTFLNNKQVGSKDHVVVLGSKAAEQLFPGQTAVGKTLYVKDVAFTVIGVLGKPAQTDAFKDDPSTNIYTGYKQWLALTEKQKFGAIVASASSEDTVDEAAESVTETLISNHAISDTNKTDFDVNTNKQLLATLNDVNGGFATTLTGLAGISLVVAGIGIMNIMLVTVTERTREIGLRRAVGAKTRHIVLQFLVEAVMLTTLGGVLGVLLGLTFTQQAGSFLNSVTPGAGGDAQIIIDLSTILMAVGTSVAVGIVFGIFPAVKAARLDPVDALRFE